MLANISASRNFLEAFLSDDNSEQSSSSSKSDSDSGANERHTISAPSSAPVVKEEPMEETIPQLSEVHTSQSMAAGEEEQEHERDIELLMQKDKSDFFDVEDVEDAEKNNAAYYKSRFELYKSRYDALVETSLKTLENLEDTKMDMLEEHVQDLATAIPLRQMKRHYTCPTELEQLMDCYREKKGALMCKPFAENFSRCTLDSKRTFLHEKDI